MGAAWWVLGVICVPYAVIALAEFIAYLADRWDGAR